MAEVFSNFGQSTLSSGINSSVTSLTVASAATFPSTGNFRIKIDSELLLVTAVSGTTFTVTRGVESTTAASHIDGATVEHVLSRLGLLNAVSEGSLTALTPSGSLPTASRVLVSDGSGKVTASSVTPTTLGYLDATSSVQTQIDAKANTADLGAVATSNSYPDLSDIPSDIVGVTGTPSVGDIMVSSDGATTIESSGIAFPLDATDTAQITNAATLPVDAGDTTGFATVATSGSYADLLNVPSQEVQQVVVEFATDWSVADGVGYFVVTPNLDGGTLTEVRGAVITAGTGSGANSFSLALNGTTISGSQVDLADGESDDSATLSEPLTANDRIRVDVLAVTGTTAAQGLIVTLVVT